MRQLALGRLRRVEGARFHDRPAAIAVYEHTKDKSHSLAYGLYYTNGGWAFAGSEYYYMTYAPSHN